jgi:transcriptional regulator with XRE-family HTH domain
MLPDKLVEIQARTGMTDAEFAAALGVSRSMWSFVRAGKKSFGIEPVANAFRVFPEVRDLIINSFLTCKVNELTRRSTR